MNYFLFFPILLAFLCLALGLQTPATGAGRHAAPVVMVSLPWSGR
jgi:hypothetical protein